MSGAPKSKLNPERKCLVTGDSTDKSGLIRFVISPDGVVTPDILGKLPGRGMYVTPSRQAFEDAEKRNPFSRAAKAKAEIPQNLLNTVEQLLVDRVINLISLGRKSGESITGFENVKEALMAERVETLFQASDGSARQKSKLKPPFGDDTHFECLTQSELGQAFGREYAIHVALLGGGLTEKIQLEAQKLRGLRVSDI